MTELSIKKWAIEDRPREKMLSNGASTLSDAELLAILIGSGNRNESAVELSRHILHYADNNLHNLSKLSIQELTSRFAGIGEAKAITIAAALELGRRRNGSERPRQDRIACSKDAWKIFHPLLCDLPHEEIWIALTNQAGKVIERTKVGQGGVSETTADMRVLLKAAIMALASGIILCHNHPSGNTNPSQADDRLTAQLKKAAGLMNIHLLDHIVIADDAYYSYADEGRL